MEKQETWKARLAEVDILDQDAIIALLNEYIFSKVDIATYGMAD